MGLYELIFENQSISKYTDVPVINISSEISFAFLQEFSKWKDNDIYAVSFFIDYEPDNQYDLRLYFGYNTETHFRKEKCKDIDDSTTRWNYNFWLQNELFCFGEDGFTKNSIDIWIKQQRIKKNQTVERFTEQVLYSVREIHKSEILKNKLGKEIPIIIHTMDYHKNIAIINMEANGKYLDRDFIDYCIRDFNN